MVNNKNKAMFKVLFIAFLQIVDFLLTWLGINELRFIEEYNPFLVNLFNLSFERSFIYRAVFVLILGMFYFIYCIYDNNSCKSKLLFIFMLICNIFVMIRHCKWVILYFNYCIIDCKTNMIEYLLVILFLSLYTITVYWVILNSIYEKYNIENIIKYLLK